MTRTQGIVLALVAALAACGKKDSSDDSTRTDKPVEDKPMACPAGNVVKDGACVQAVMPKPRRRYKPLKASPAIARKVNDATVNGSP